ncbi:hypothetical protein AC579_4752 [Pseudocercospora musae]|uniref:Uncharacterized protein n=1 Tax=Pseudocercospora musae TaxID=113226 RepID=A0A139IQN8_9PEZI|nr:hypothetical protein AC579_4752 [Pseudocercospora musae]
MSAEAAQAPVPEISIRTRIDWQNVDRDHYSGNLITKISLDASTQEMLTAIKNECRSYRRRHSDEAWDELAMEASIGLGDFRDTYVNFRTDTGNIRFENVRDLFPDLKRNTFLDVQVKIKPQRQVNQNLLTAEWEVPVYKHHRIATEGRRPAPIKSQHSQMVDTFLIAYPRSALYPNEYSLRLVSFREINGILIGSCEGDCSAHCSVGDLFDPEIRPPWLNTDHLKGPYRLPFTQGSPKELQDRLIEHMNKTRTDPGEETDIPVLPSMTFQPFGPTTTLGKFPIEDIHLAVRFVSRFEVPELKGMLLLPANVLVNIPSKIDSGKSVRKFLVEALVDETRKPRLAMPKRVLFEDGLVNWRLDLWVMPQSRQLGRLYQFRRDERLKRFLDPDMEGLSVDNAFIASRYVCALLTRWFTSQSCGVCGSTSRNSGLKFTSRLCYNLYPYHYKTMSASIDTSNTTSEIKIAFGFIWIYHPERTRSLTSTVPFDTTTNELLEDIEGNCIEYREDNPEYSWKEQAMDVGLRLGDVHAEDERDIYVNYKDSFGLLRFHLISDMLQKAPNGHSVDLWVDIWILPVNEAVHARKAGAFTVDSEGPERKHYRIAIEETPAIHGRSQHRPMVRSLIAVHPGSVHSLNELKFYEIYQRDGFNGDLAGSYDDCNEYTIDDILDNQKRPQWLKLKNFERKYHFAFHKRNRGALLLQIWQHMTLSRQSFFEEDDAPVLPAMTFQPFVPKPGAESLDVRDIHIAVRFVNKLSLLCLDFLQLPMNVLAIIPAEDDSAQAVCDLLLSRLRDNALLSPLFLHSVGDKWSLELWVLPQEAESSCVAEKLHRFRDEPKHEQDQGHKKKKRRTAKHGLKMFFKPEVVREGDRRLFVEAHFVCRVL